MQLIDLTPEERKKVLSVFTIKDLRKAAEKSDFNQNHYIKRFTKKLDRISKKEIDDYVSKVYINLDDPIVDQCISAICMAIGAKFQYADEVASLLEDTAYDDISDELRDELEEYRDAFESSGLKLDYETFIKLNTHPDPFEALQKIYTQLLNDHTEVLGKLSEVITTMDKLTAEKNKLQNELKKNKNETSNLRGDHEANKEKIRHYKKLLSPQNIKSSVSKELGCSINGKTYDDIYQELSVKEAECLKNNKLTDAMTVLAAKYAVITGMKALILKRGKDSSYVYMGIADLKILTAKSSYSNRFGYSRRLVIITAAGEFVDGSFAEEEEPLKKYGAIDPKTYEVVTKAHYRSPNVAEYARKKANGICQLCGQRAPFDDLSGQPYLEVHHVKWLSRGGSDTYDNVVALCPNCHSKMHVIDDPEDIKTLESVVGSQNDN